MQNHKLRCELALSFDEALECVPAALQTEGFGVLTRVDVQATLREKLDVPFRRYQILGACNPAFAHRALQAELDVGLAMPCNVILYATDDGKTVVQAVDPTQTIAALGHAELAGLAAEVRTKLERALDQLQTSAV